MCNLSTCILLTTHAKLGTRAKQAVAYIKPRVCGTHARGLLKMFFPNQTKGRLKVFLHFQTAFLYPYPYLFFQPCNQFIGQVEISLGAFGVGVVGEGGEAVAGGFGEADVAGDDGVEE